MTSQQPDFAPESRLLTVTVGDLVAMRNPAQTFIDAHGRVLGLGSGDVVELSIPPFQRGLRWGESRLQGFQNSIIQGWPIGVFVVAVTANRAIRGSRQRRILLSLIDGQQRLWALTRLIDDFWREPWIMFDNPKWENHANAATGPIAEAGRARDGLAKALKRDPAEVASACRSLSREGGPEVFQDYPQFLAQICNRLHVDTTRLGAQANIAARKLCKAIDEQFTSLQDVPVPVLLLDEALNSELPTVFRRLNDGVPLKGYDLLAAMWLHERLAQTPKSSARTRMLNSILAVSEKRILDTYANAGTGYVVDPNLEPLTFADLSLFDLLYFTSQQSGSKPGFAFPAEVLAFQVSALAFTGKINKVDDDLRTAFPQETTGKGPDITVFPAMLDAASDAVSDALRPLMDVSSSTLQLKGRLGLTPAVVYISTFLTHHSIVTVDKAPRLHLRRRTQSALDRQVAPGEYLGAKERHDRLKKNLPSWFVHDALTSVFAGSRAYEAVTDRVWADFAAGTRSTRTYRLEVANTMMMPPPLSAMRDAFQRLWKLEMDVSKTPERRRVSEGGAVLFRAAYSNLAVHDSVLDHAIPWAKGRAAATRRGEAYPLNHVANMMPLSDATNSIRGDKDWDTFIDTLTVGERSKVKSALLLDPSDVSSRRLKDYATFRGYLEERYLQMIRKAMENLGHREWEESSTRERNRWLADLDLG